ncbi:hypothetical protein FQN50_009565 [Emmonsiellopsis sp. PD_5]|nr:hypothetical protein FQN50_009565 [Emmonsiellopsis sp. PD_5]
MLFGENPTLEPSTDDIVNSLCSSLSRDCEDGVKHTQGVIVNGVFPELVKKVEVEMQVDEEVDEDNYLEYLEMSEKTGSKYIPACLKAMCHQSSSNVESYIRKEKAKANSTPALAGSECDTLLRQISDKLDW